MGGPDVLSGQDPDLLPERELPEQVVEVGGIHADDCTRENRGAGAEPADLLGHLINLLHSRPGPPRDS
jgi:hypothetical protein